MKPFILLVLLYATSLFSQTIDYNTKKGFAANGYDVVSYFNNKALKGNNKFTTTFDGVNYKFSSEENRNLFIKNPDKYIPQYGGYCAYAIALKNDKVSINPESFLIRDGKLYLFYNAWGTNTLELWNNEDPKELQQRADKNWETIKFKKQK
ncbi:YHS domain-containing (seleno)protein [Algibacter sp. 2305UL17-15]|uniref:YHS domain-containing (seleno)protein n=1 Tax=Algibacter sp. 2305UL17-15 TaxID=3231268 RepID=UPI00345A5F20